MGRWLICGLVSSLLLMSSGVIGERPEINRKNLTDWADLICIVRVVSERSLAIDVHKTELREEGLVVPIMTEHEAEILDVLSGDIQDSHVKIRTMGGVLGNRGLWTPASASMDVGMVAVVYLRKAGDFTRVVGLASGRDLLIQGRDLDEIRAINGELLDEIEAEIPGRSFAPRAKMARLFSVTTPTVSSVTYETGQSGTSVGTDEDFFINGSGFYEGGSQADKLWLLSTYNTSGTLLWDGSAHNGLQLYWDTSLLLDLNDIASSAKGSTFLYIKKESGGQTVTSGVYNNLYVDFHLHGYTIPSSSLTYKYDFSSANFHNDTDSTDAESAFDSARTSWNNACGVTFNKTSSTSSNKVRWANLGIDGPSAHNILWLTGTDIDSSEIEFHSSDTWSIDPNSSEYDLQTIMLHELGHSAGLDHRSATYDTNSAMKVHFVGQKVRTLDSGDERGGEWVYP